jgi:hypothetical protein
LVLKAAPVQALYSHGTTNPTSKNITQPLQVNSISVKQVNSCIPPPTHTCKHTRTHTAFNEFAYGAVHKHEIVATVCVANSIVADSHPLQHKQRTLDLHTQQLLGPCQNSLLTVQEPTTPPCNTTASILLYNPLEPTHGNNSMHSISCCGNRKYRMTA